MDLSPTDLQLVSFDLYKTDEKYDFKLTDILRRRHRPLLFIVDGEAEVIYSCKPDDNPPGERFTPTITAELIDMALREAKQLMSADNEPVGSITRQIIINKPFEKCALTVLHKQFWCIRVFEMDSSAEAGDARYAVLVEPIGTPHSEGLDMQKVQGLFRLSRRESDVVEELTAGGTDKEIAQQLGISVETVRAYLKSVRAKLGVSTRTAIVSAVHNLRDDHTPSSK